MDRLTSEEFSYSKYLRKDWAIPSVRTPYMVENSFLEKAKYYYHFDWEIFDWSNVTYLKKIVYHRNIMFQSQDICSYKSNITYLNA